MTASAYPFPTVCADKQSTDWFQAITRTLKWNERQRQKSFVVVEQARDQPHDPAASKKQAEQGNRERVSSSINIDATAKKYEGGGHSSAAQGMTKADVAVKDELTEEEEDEGFDIDDISSSSTPSDPAKKVHNEAKGNNARQSSPPTIHPPASAATLPSLHRADTTSDSGDKDDSVVSRNSGDEDSDGPQSSHHQHHLRQYATESTLAQSSSSRPGGGVTSPRSERTPRPFANSRSSFNDQQQTPKAGGGTGRRSKKVSVGAERGGEKVKAFVVFGADSSDAESTASDDY